MKKTLVSLLLSGLMTSPAFAQSSESNPFESTRTIDLCVEYHDATSERQAILLKELERRAQLTEKDYDHIKNRTIANSATQCGMYMALGKPLAEEGRQLRPFVYKVVHVYPTQYIVTQMGMVVEVHERKEGMMPPSLSVDKPQVQEAPVIYNTPGHRAHP